MPIGQIGVRILLLLLLLLSRFSILFSGILLQGSPSCRLPFLFGRRRSPPNLSALKKSKLNVVFLCVVGGMDVAGGMAPISNTKYQFPPRCQCTFFRSPGNQPCLRPRKHSKPNSPTFLPHSQLRAFLLNLLPNPAKICQLLRCRDMMLERATFREGDCFMPTGVRRRCLFGVGLSKS